jgi:AcrR family transcriptional regulator
VRVCLASRGALHSGVTDFPLARTWRKKNAPAVRANAYSKRASRCSIARARRKSPPRTSPTSSTSSPGNLYYHFRNKEEIVGELFTAFEARLLPLLADPGERAIGVEDLWLWLHLLFERLWEYRFLFRDIDALTRGDHRFGMRFGELLRKCVATVSALCRSMVGARTMAASEREIGALAQNAVLVTTYWPSFDRVRRARREVPAADAGRAAYQVLALFAPYLVGDSRRQLDRLAADYL